MSKPITSIAIIGGGFMGAGIAETAAVAGVPVVVRELPEYLDATNHLSFAVSVLIVSLRPRVGGAVSRG